MNKLLIYPYSHENMCLVQYAQMLEDYTLTSCVTLDDQHNTIFSNSEEGNPVTVSSDFESELSHCDSVLFLDSCYNWLKDIYKAKIKKTIANNKQVLISQFIYDECKEFIGNSDLVKILGNPVSVSEYLESNTEKLFEPFVPVVTVMSPGECCDKFEAQLEIKKTFESSGYRVLQIGTKEYSELFGMKAIPSFLLSRDVSLPKKVEMLNYYINSLLAKEEYDVVVIGVPGGVLPFDKTFRNFFGELALVVSHAFNIDINVNCCYHNREISYDNLEEIRAFFKGRFGCETNYFYMANTQFRITEEDGLEYLRLDQEYCEKNMPEKINRNGVQLCHRLDMEEKEKFFHSIVEELEDNIELI